MISITVLSSYLFSLIYDLLEIIKTIVLLSFTNFAPQQSGISYTNIFSFCILKGNTGMLCPYKCLRNPMTVRV